LKKKIGTILDESLVLEAKKVALTRGLTFSQILEDALENYLKQTKHKEKKVALTTKGSMKVSKRVLKQIMEEEGVYDS